MLTKSVSHTAPLDSEVHRVKARHRRRDAAAPYLKRKKEDEDEKDIAFYGKGTSSATHTRRRSGFLARLASYIPIVNKLVPEEEEEEGGELQSAMDDSADIQTTQEDLEEDDEVVDEAENEQGTPGITDQQTRKSLQSQAEKQKEGIPEDEKRMETMSPVTHPAPLFVAPKESLATPPRPYSKRTSRKSRSPSRDSSVESGERSPAFMRQLRKRGDKRVFLPGPSHHSKMLRINNSQHRRQSTSPTPHDSALTVIKQKKTITLEEFERLQKQLHDMVETTPQTQLAMTQAALANGLEHPFTRGFPGPTSFPGYVPGSIAHSNNGAMVVHDERKQKANLASKNGLPFGKRARNQENRPLLFSGSVLRGQLTREERLMRKPRPSRLLTGAKRDVAARNAYSAAVAEKILSTLNKIETPLEREAQKPTPSTSLSWAKYHLSLVDNEKKSLENGKPSNSDEIAPPTCTLPRVTFPQSAREPSTMATPVKSVANALESTTPLFSPQTVSITPAPPVKARVPEQPKSEKIGTFEFTLPLRSEGCTQIDVNDEDTCVKFTFSPPPSLCEPPGKVAMHKTTTKTHGGAAPFHLVSSSPKVTKTEGLSGLRKTKELNITKAVVEKPVAPPEAKDIGLKTPASDATSTSSVVNPLAKFMQLKPGQWKCPGCSVLNESSSAKCPCCETVKPIDGNASKVAVTTAPSVSGSISSCGFSFGASPADSERNKSKPIEKKASSASSFSFGATGAEPKKEIGKPAGSISSSGSSFGTSELGIKKVTDKLASSITSSEFNFTAPTPASDSKKSVAEISFGVSDTSTSEKEIVTGSTPISFEFSKRANLTSTDVSSIAEKTATASSITFGMPSSAVVQVPTDKNARLTFGATIAESTNKGKRKASEVEELKKDDDLSLRVSAASTRSCEAPKLSDVSTFSFEAASEPAQAVLKDPSRPTKRLAPSSVTSEAKLEASIPAFSFGSASKPPQVLVKEVPGAATAASKPSHVPTKEATGAASAASSLPFSTLSSFTTTVKSKEVTVPSFDFRSASASEKTIEAKPIDTAPSKSGFTFGSSPSTPTLESNVGFGQPKNNAPVFSFGASSTDPKSATSASVASTGFTFGQSSTASTTKCASVFGVAPPTSASPAFGFEKPPPSTATLTSSTPSTPAFTFGSSLSTQPAAPSNFGSSGSSAFGQKPVSTLGSDSASSAFGMSSSGPTPFGQKPASATDFGSTSSAFGSNSSSGFGSMSNTGGFNSSATTGLTTAFAQTTPTAPAFSFGASSQTSASSAPAAGQPAFSFGASSAPSGFGAVPVASKGFGSSASGGFNAAPGGFQSSSPAPAFGNQAPSTAPAFGNTLPPPSITFGAPSFGAPAASGFGSGPSSSGFRTPSPTSAFGNALGPPAFGAAPAFGAPAPVSAFGAAPAPAPNAFGAPSTDGGFNMGAAPQHAKGRRILKAKPRSRRTT